MFHVKHLIKIVKERPLHRLLFYLFVLTIPLQTRFILNTEEAYIQDYFSYHKAIFVYLSDLLFILFTISYLASIKIRTKLLWIISAPIIWALLQWFHVEHTGLWLFASLKTAQIWLIAYYIVVSRPNIKVLMGLLAVSGVLQSLLAIIQFHMQQDLGLRILGEYIPALYEPGTATLDTPDGKVIRSYGTTPHPNVLAGLLTFSILGFLYVSRETKGLWNWIIVSCGTIVVLWGLSVTFSRTAWLASAVILGIYMAELFVRKMTKMAFIIGILLIVSCGTLLFGYKNVIFPRISNATLPDNQAVSYRQEFNSYGLDLFKISPLVGVGPGQYIPFLEENYNLEPWEHQPAHNIAIYLFAEIGIIGIIIWAFSFYKLGFTWNITVPPAQAIVLIGVLGSFDHYLITIQQGILLFGIALGIVLHETSCFTQRETSTN